MNSKKLNAGRIFVVRVDKGEEVISSLTKFCEKEGVTSGVVWGLGAFGEADFVVGASENEVKPRMETVRGPIEVGVAHGNIALKEGKPFVHLHVAASLLSDVDKSEAFVELSAPADLMDKTKEGSEQRSINSHVARAIVSLTGEFVVMETSEFERAFDEKIKMFTWKP